MFGEPLGFLTPFDNKGAYTEVKIPYFAEITCQRCKKKCSIKLTDATSIKARQHQSAGIKMFIKNSKGCEK